MRQPRNQRFRPAWHWKLAPFACALLLCSIESTQPATAQTVPTPRDEVASKLFRVTMTTRFVVPKKDRQISEIRVYHALPTSRPWSLAEKGLASANLAFSPLSGALKWTKTHESHFILWRQNQDTAPGTALEFQSNYTVRSVHRNFVPSRHELKWPTTFETPKGIEPVLARVADAIKAQHDPGHAVIEFSKWIRANISYDAGVPYPTSDVAAICAGGKGHCGHRLAVFRQLCRQVGLQVRPVRGMALGTPDASQGKLHQIAATYENMHVWAEVFFPEVGWVEVEPGYGGKAFSIPAKFIQNNKWFQTYVIWITENGVAKRPSWDYEDGHYSSDYGIQNLIDFSEVTG